MLMTRAEHLAWCKQRALEYLDRGETRDALASMFSDLGKHEGTKGHAGIQVGVTMMMMGLLTEPEETRRYIEGFN